MSGGEEEEVLENHGGLILGCWDHEKTPTLIQDLEHSVNLVERKCIQLFNELIYYKKYLEESKKEDFHVDVCKVWNDFVEIMYLEEIFNPRAGAQLWDIYLGALSIAKRDSLQLEPFFRRKGGTLLHEPLEKTAEGSNEVHVIDMHVNHMSPQKHFWVLCSPECLLEGKARKNSNFCYGSDPDIAFRKNFINFQEVQQVFEEKFKAKLCCINKELREAARKIGLKDNIILFRPNDRRRAEDEAEKWCCQSRKSLRPFFSGKTKSDPIIIEHGEEEEFSKITKDELEIYQKLSRLSMKKGEKKKKSKGRKMKFHFKRKCPRCRQDFRTRKAESNKSKLGKSKFREREKRMSVLQAKSHSPCDSLSKVNSQEKLKEPELKEKCKSLKESQCGRNVQRSWDGAKVAAEGNVSLGAAIRKAVPFTACTSTSRSHNIGLNLQQLLSLTKHGKTFAPEKRTQNSEFGEVKSSNKITSNNTEKEQIIPCTPDTRNSEFENFEASQQEHKQKVWTPESGKSSTSRKVRSKYTGSSPEEVLQYQKSTTRQCAKSTVKSEWAYVVDTRVLMSSCRRTDVFRTDDLFENASGDGTCNGCIEPDVEWSKVYGSFLSMCRKYACLKEKLNDDRLVAADEELKSLENEIDYSIEKYKDFLQFYSKFLQLNHRLKWLKNACESAMFEPVATFTSDSRRKMYPTHSSNLKKALKEVQTLQEKIRLVNA